MCKFHPSNLPNYGDISKIIAKSSYFGASPLGDLEASRPPDTLIVSPQSTRIGALESLTIEGRLAPSLRVRGEFARRLRGE